MRRFGPKKRTRADMARAVDALFRNARSLDNITAETLVRSYGMKPAEAEQRLAREKAGRKYG